MSIDLSSYTNIGSALLVRLTIGKYRATPNAAPVQNILKFSDSNTIISINTDLGLETYVGTGQLLNITPSRSEFKNTGSDVTITLSGIPNSSIAEIVNSTIKGSRVEIYRVLLDSATDTPLDVSGNPVGRFFGIVTNYALEEDYDVENRIASNTITLACSSWVSVLNEKVTGRRTNPVDQQFYYPGDTSMNRVPNLTGANYNFGAPE